MRTRPCPIKILFSRAWPLMIIVWFFAYDLQAQSNTKAITQDEKELKEILMLIRSDDPEAGFEQLDSFVTKYIQRDSIGSYIPALVEGINAAVQIKRFAKAEELYHRADSLMVLAKPRGYPLWRYYHYSLVNGYVKVLHETGDKRAAEQLYHTTMDEMNRLSNPTKDEEVLLTNLEKWFVKVLKEAGRWPEAMRYYDRIIAVQQNMNRPDLLLHTRANRAGTLREIGYPDSARQELLLVIQTFRNETKQLLSFINATTYSDRLCYYLIELAACYLDLGLYEEALARMQELKKERSKLSNNPIWVDMYKEAIVLHAMGRHIQALDQANTAYSLYKNRIKKEKHSLEFLLGVNLLISEIHSDLGNTKAALVQLDTLEQMVKIQIGDPFSDVLSSASLMPFIQIYYERSRVSELRYRSHRQPSTLSALGESCRSAKTLLHQLQSGLPDAETLVFLNNYGRKINLIGMAYADYAGLGQTLDEAIAFGESGKTILLDLAVRQHSGDMDPLVPKELQVKELALRTEITDLYAQLKKTKKEEKPNIQKKITARQDEREKLMAQFKANYPDFYHEQFERIFPNAKTLRKSLPAGAAILTYTWQDTIMYGLVFSATAERLIRIQVPDSLTAMIRDFRLLITDKPSREAIWGSPQSQEFVKQARYFYQLLVAPFADLLPARVLLIPDGVLAYLPFDCLLTRDPLQGEAWSSLPYFIRDHALSTHFSISTWQRLESSSEKNYKIDYIGFAPDFTAGLSTETVSRRDILSPLLHNRAEIETGLQLLGGKAWYDQDASLHNFRQVAGQARIIHLATHGKANDRIGDESFIAFANTGPRSKENPADTLLVRDIYSEIIPAALVILSACETGIGEVLAGEGIIGLNNGFVHAGVRSLLSTLWSVDDLAMSQIIEIYLEALKEGNTKDVALQQAKLMLLTDPSKSHPYYWSATIQQGSLQPLYPSTWTYWAGGLAGICIIGLGMVYLRKRRA